MPTAEYLSGKTVPEEITEVLEHKSGALYDLIKAVLSIDEDAKVSYRLTDNLARTMHLFI